MTRTQFIENVTTWYELLDFCSDEQCYDIVENICDNDRKDEYIDDDLVDMARNADNWQDLYRQLEDIPTGYDYYIMDEYGEFCGADDDDFERYKDDVLEWCDDNDIWDDEEEEGYDAEESDEEEPIDDDAYDDFVVEEGCSIGELFGAGASCLRTIAVEENRKKELEEDAFKQLFSVAG